MGKMTYLQILKSSTSHEPLSKETFLFLISKFGLDGSNLKVSSEAKNYRKFVPTYGNASGLSQKLKDIQIFVEK